MSGPVPPELRFLVGEIDNLLNIFDSVVTSGMALERLLKLLSKFPKSGVEVNSTPAPPIGVLLSSIGIWLGSILLRAEKPPL